MTQSIISLERLPISDDAILKFSGGSQILVRILDDNEGVRIILTPNNKLVRINKNLSCVVLAEHVTIR